MSITDKLLEIDPNVVYEVFFYCTLLIEEQYRNEKGEMVPNLFSDDEEDYPPFIDRVEGEVHIYHEAVVVIPITDHTVNTLDQAVRTYILPAVCVLDIRPLYSRKEKTK